MKIILNGNYSFLLLFRMKEYNFESYWMSINNTFKKLFVCTFKKNFFLFKNEHYKNDKKPLYLCTKYLYY